jgi:hypothetical protein
MKTMIVATLGVLVVAALALAIIPTTRDEIHWRWASHKDETASYESYVKTWPEGRHAAEAQARYDEHGWADAESSNTVTQFERYVQLHGEGKHITEAKDNIESRHWREAAAANTVQGFERYVQLHGEGKHITEAKDNIESRHWREAAAANTVTQFERYVQLHGEGKHITEAKDNIESLHWQEAAAANTIRSYRIYTSAYPQGRFAQQAKAKASALRTDQAPYNAALRTGTEASFRAFLADYPGHTKEAAVQQALREIAEGRDIVDLLHEKKIAIQAQGSGIEQVSVRIRRLVTYPLTVRIPVGSFFVSSNSSAQNMVTTAESKVRLTTEEWLSVSPAAACANRPRDIPGSSDAFTVQRSPHQAELAKLMPVLERARVDTETRQAAVWIVTDDADYGDLGILVAGQSGFGGSRVIHEQETARAMKICHEAGIDITKKAIWRDRQQIISGLKDGDLKTWLKGKK